MSLYISATKVLHEHGLWNEFKDRLEPILNQLGAACGDGTEEESYLLTLKSAANTGAKNEKDKFK